jgi:hypothetical protein
LSSDSMRAGQWINWADEEDRYIAESWSVDYEELLFTIDYLKSEDLIDGWVSDEEEMPADYDYVNEPARIAPAGWARIAELQAQISSSDQGFVAMWFADEMTPFYKEVLAPVIEDSGYRHLRIDTKEHVNRVDDEIMVEIKKASS